ncbi:MAG: tyrosine-type recombinase/integrase [Synergistaceae bacterium]
MGLSEMSVRNSKPKEELYFLKDDNGLFLEVWPNGRKTWRLRYWVGGKERKKTLGPYPLLSLKEARERRDEARKSLLNGIDPFSKAIAPAYVFDTLAMEWWQEHKKTLRSAKNIQTMEHRITAYIIPVFKGRDPQTITSHELLDMVEAIENKGKIETAHRTLDILRQIFRYILRKRLIDRNPAMDLRGLIEPRKQEHHPSLTEPRDIARLRDKIKGYSGGDTVRNAMLYSLYTFARPGEVRHAEWKEINWETKEWHIPAIKMKAGVKHIVPLSEQAILILEEQKKISFKNGNYIFPAVRSSDGKKTYSDATINKAFIRQMGYPPRTVTAHGFRSTASTRLNESGLWSIDAIEHQLAHSGNDRVRKAYNYAKYLPERRKMMQWYADYIDGLKA